jgi:hypothetical protein
VGLFALLMPIYFFRLSTVEILPDDEGEELPSREAATALAKEVAHDLSASQQPSYVLGKAVVVTDEAGTELFRTPLKVETASRRYDKSGMMSALTPKVDLAGWTTAYGGCPAKTSRLASPFRHSGAACRALKRSPVVTRIFWPRKPMSVLSNSGRRIGDPFGKSVAAN